MLEYGYMGKIAEIDLSNRLIHVIELEEVVARTYIGGSGLSAFFLAKNVQNINDPLGAENPLIFMTGPLTATKCFTSGRHSVASISPLTGIWCESDAGGSWGITLKKAGFDGLIIRGQSPNPVFVAVENEEITIRDASFVWGKNTFSTYEAIKSNVGRDAEVACIGRAGENLVPISSIMTDGRNARAAGRGGLGAVMGSKKLKAISVKGNKEFKVFDAETLQASLQAIAPKIRSAATGLSQLGTARSVRPMEEIGDLPIKNWALGSWKEGAEKISGEEMARTILTKQYYCPGCIIGCGREVEIKNGPFQGLKGAGPEYETLGALGSLCLNDNLESVAFANELCNDYGLDTISTGNAIAFAMEGFEKGWIKESEFKEQKISWGDGNKLADTIVSIGENNGLGAILGQGVKKAAEYFGESSVEAAIHVKGLEFPMHDPRAMNSLAIAYATSNRGACHLQAVSHALELRISMPEFGYDEPLDRFLNEGKGVMTAKMQDFMTIFDSAKLCKFLLFTGFKVQDFADWLNAVTGFDYSAAELMTIGERIFTLKRMINNYRGVRKEDDQLPSRILNLRLEGGSKGNVPDLEKMLKEYYAFRDWDDQGCPSDEKVKELELENIFEDVVF